MQSFINEGEKNSRHTSKKMKPILTVFILAIFGIGIGIGTLLGNAYESQTINSYKSSTRTISPAQNQLLLEEPPVNALATEIVADGPAELISPSDWIKESRIEMRQDGVFFHIDNPQWAILANTNSMDPVFDETSHLIQIEPETTRDIHLGDIVSYDSPLGFLIVHRVIEIGEDPEGWYAILKGDNNPSPDPWKIRFEMIKRVTVIVVY